MEVRLANDTELEQVTSWLQNVFSANAQSHYGLGHSFDGENIPLEYIKFSRIISNNSNAPIIFTASREEYSLPQVEPITAGKIHIIHNYENYGPFGNTETKINLNTHKTTKISKVGFPSIPKKFHFFVDSGHRVSKPYGPVKMIVAGIGVFFGGESREQFNYTIAQV